MNPTYRNLMLTRVHAAMAASQAASTLSHAGTKGQMREIFVRDLLRPLLPVFIGIGTGIIIDSTGRQSAQQDVVVYDTRLLPPLLMDASIGTFPVESVLYSIEVKSRLTADSLRAADAAAGALSDFEYVPALYDNEHNPQESQILNLVPTLFAFDTDLSEQGISEVARYDKIRGDKPPGFRNLCVAGRGCWWWYKNQWHSYVPTYPYEEILVQLAGVANNYGRVSLTRGAPKLGRYLISD